MTQSSSNAPKDSDTDKVLDAANDNHNDTRLKSTTDLPLDSTTEGQGNGVAVEAEAESKIIISSPSPDVVIAEVSESDSTQDSSAKPVSEANATADITREPLHWNVLHFGQCCRISLILHSLWTRNLWNTPFLSINAQTVKHF